MGDTATTERNEKHGTSSDLMNTYIIAGIGFSCLIGWELSATFSPSLPLLNFCDIQTAIILRIISISTLAASFVFFVLKEDWVFEHRNKVFTISSLLALFTVVNTMVNYWVEGIPLAFSVFAWAVFGIAQASIMMYWCILFSLIPTRRTAITVGVGSVGGTLLFVFVNASNTEWLSLLEISFLIIGSVGLAALLSMKISPDRILPVKDYLRSALLTAPAALSVLCHGAVYGFMSIMLCAMGPTAALIGGASGIFGTLLALLWGILGPKVDIDTGIVQRISLPLLVSGLLFFPLFGEVGKVVCGCIVITSLAHSQVIAWYSTSIDNAEFRLHPVDRFAMRQTPNWIGFLFGSIIAYLFTFTFSLSTQDLLFCMIVFSVIVVIVFSIYGGDESKTKNRLNDLLTSAADESNAEDEQDSSDKTHVNFRQRCEAVVEIYDLTTREAEVFFMLAKGRNAEFIANQLVVSAATVKSHIYHIYRKLGINSQQRLMTIVDEATPDR